MRYLTNSLDALNATPREKAAILTIRQTVPQISRGEAVALAIMLLNSYSVTLGRWLAMAAARNFSQGLTTAVLQISALSPAVRLGIAMELLRAEFLATEFRSDRNETEQEQAVLPEKKGSD